MQKAVADPNRRTPPSRAGARAFRWSRVTAVCLILLLPYGLYVLASVAGKDLIAIRQVFALPFNALAMLALVGIGAWHMRLGMREILEDYARGSTLGALLVANTLFCLAIVLTAGGAVVKLWLGA